ncbi:hypothetical protein [Nanchangia anserum]|uniref:Uncharacterized protein n=1 Tax=Nanchangia anserum TaxID=2692125 RepID=A0A8I0GBU4_9ACTO|nr:hypothetical protein [Nanchangia anserum]MBD3689290.1 hypothetical protein [Nanchangia anserum]
MGRASIRMRHAFVVIAVAVIALLIGDAVRIAGIVHEAPRESEAPVAMSRAQRAIYPTADNEITPGARSPLVVIGVSGLTSADLRDISRYPALAERASTGAIANQVVRGADQVACPVDGWLSLQASQRLSDRAGRAEGTCPNVADVADHGMPADGLGGPDDAHLGLLGQALEAFGISTRAIGPGARIALGTPTHPAAGEAAAASDGELARQVAEAASSTRVTVVDADVDVPDLQVATPGHSATDTWEGFAAPPPTDTRRATRLLTRLNTIVAELDDNTQVIITSLADGTSLSSLQATILSTDAMTSGYARSGSTRTNGLVLTADITQLILTSAGLPVTSEGQGMAITGGGGTRLALSNEDAASALASSQLEERIDRLADAALHARVTLSIQPLVMVVLAVVALACLFLLIRLVFAHRLGNLPRRRRRILTVLALIAACAPPSTFLANLVPWWRLSSGAPVPAMLAVLAVTALISLVIVAVAAGVAQLVRALAPEHDDTRWVGLIVITLALTGLLVGGARASRLSLDAVMGSSSLLGARFYGIGNTQFALVVVLTLTAAALIGSLLVRRGYRLAGLIVAAAGGMWVVSIDGAASLGADVGGPLALTPGVLVLTILLIRGYLRRIDIVWIALLTLGILTHFGLRDFARPAQERSHAGSFVAALAEGHGGAAFHHKIAAMVGTFIGSGLGIVSLILAVVVALAIAWGLRRLTRMRQRPDVRAVLTGLRRVPGLTPLAAAGLLSTILAALVNDSGLIIVGAAALIALPLFCAGLLTASLPLPAAPRLPKWRGAAVAVLSLIGIGAVVATLLGPSPTPSSSGDREELSAHRTVVLYTHSLSWQRLRYAADTGLGAQIDRSWMFNVIPLRTSSGSCPLDAFLATNAAAPVSSRSLGGRDLCMDIPLPREGEPVAGWEYFRAAEAAGSHTSRLGALGDAVAKHHVDAHAIGGNAAAVLARSNGSVAATVQERPTSDADMADAVAASVSQHRLTVVDAEAASVNDDPTRQIQAAARIRHTELAAAEARGEDPATIVDQPITEVSAALNPLRGASGTPIGDLVRSHPGILPHRSVDLSATGGRAWRIQAAQAAQQERRLATILAGLPRDVTVIVVSTTTASPSREMGAGMIITPKGSGGLGHSGSVRQAGMVQLADVGVSIAASVGLDSSDLVEPAGSVISGVALGSQPQARWTKVLNDSTRASAISTARNAFHTPLRSAATLIFLLAAIATIRPVYRRLVPTIPGGRGSERVLGRLVCLTLAAQPVAAFLVSLTPWWRAASPSAVLGWGTWGLGAILATLALLAWRSPLGPMIAISGATMALLALDIATGSQALIDAPLGFNSLAGARFYGAGNEAYTLMATGFFFSVGLGAAWLIDRGHRLGGLAVFVGAGIVLVIIDGAPNLGADFGGPLSLLPGIAVGAILLARARLSWRKLVLALGGTALVGVGLAVADWLRPPASRTHLGRFIESSLHGDLVPIITRKLGANLAALTWSGHRWVVLAALVLAAGTLAFGLRATPAPAPTPGRRLGERLRAARIRAWGWLAPSAPDASARTRLDGITAMTIAWVVTEVFGFALNDSGILLPGLGAILAVPLLLDVVIASRAHARDEKRAAE